jgi:hypothetical protein
VNWQESTQQIKTLAANVAVANAQKKKENPYLSHRQPQAAVVVTGLGPVQDFVDERLGHLAATRDSRARKAFQFIEAGTYVSEENKMRAKEERKVIGGYASGRRAPEMVDGAEAESEETEAGAVPKSSSLPAVPAPDEGLIVPPTHIG